MEPSPPVPRPPAPAPLPAGTATGFATPHPSVRARPFFADKNKAFWQLQTAGWGGYLVLRTATALANSFPFESVIRLVFQVATGYSLTLLLAAIYRSVIHRSNAVRGSASLIAMLMAAITYALIDAWMNSAINRTGTTLDLKDLVAYLTLDFTVVAAWSALYYAINFYLIVEEQVDEMQRLEVQAASAQLAMLRYQLNPHFLFNTLNSISTLVLLAQTERASAMLQRLSSFLRFTLVNEPTGTVTLEQEVDTLKLYLEIEKMRFDTRLRTAFDIEPEALKARLPSLLLQPLVENAIKYAVTPQEEGAQIDVSARLVQDDIRVVVSDTGPGLPGEADAMSLSTGVGLANIRDRLAQAYGEAATMDAGPLEDGGYRVVLTWPFDTQGAQRKVAQ